MKEQISITIDEMLLSEIDDKRGMVPRSTYIESTLRKNTTDAKYEGE